MSRIILGLFVIGSVVNPGVTVDYTRMASHFINSTFRTIVSNYNSNPHYEKD
jgi:hypothetical protein